jgi:hypothetical protein
VLFYVESPDEQAAADVLRQLPRSPTTDGGLGMAAE